MLEQVLQERVLGLLEESLQRIGVGGVAGLGALGLRHPPLLEEHHLELLGRAEVDLLADHGVRRLGSVADADGEPLLELLEELVVDGDADLLHAGQHVDERQLDVGEQAGAAALGQLVVEGRGEVEHGTGVQHRRLAAALVVDPVEAELAVVARPGLQLTLEVAHGEVREVVGPLVGPGQVGRQRRVAIQAEQGPAAGGQRQHRPLGVVEHLRLPGVTEPGHDRRVVLRADRSRRPPGRPCRRRWRTRAR